MFSISFQLKSQHFPSLSIVFKLFDYFFCCLNRLYCDDLDWNNEFNCNTILPYKSSLPHLEVLLICPFWWLQNIGLPPILCSCSIFKLPSLLDPTTIFSSVSKLLLCLCLMLTAKPLLHLHTHFSWIFIRFASFLFQYTRRCFLLVILIATFFFPFPSYYLLLLMIMLSCLLSTDLSVQSW